MPLSRFICSPVPPFFFLPLLSACICSREHFPGLVGAPPATSLPAPPRGRPRPAPSADPRSLLPTHWPDPGHRDRVLAQPPSALRPRRRHVVGCPSGRCRLPELLRWENPAGQCPVNCSAHEQGGQVHARPPCH